jgi:hypothetical protein
MVIRPAMVGPSLPGFLCACRSNLDCRLSTAEEIYEALKCVAEALKTSAEKIGDESCTVKRCLALRLVYATSYYSAFGVVFPMLFIVRAVPLPVRLTLHIWQGYWLPEF